MLDAGARTGHVDEHAHQRRLSPTLAASQQAWIHAAGRWAELTGPASRTDLDLVHAANELRAAVRELTYDKTTWARPDIMAGRVDLGAAAQDLQQALSTAVDIAYLTRDVAATDRHLTGPARAMSRRANADSGPADGHGEDLVWVPISDLHANRLVPIPDPVRDGLVADGDTVIQAANSAMSAAACLDRTPAPAVGTMQAPAPKALRAEDLAPSPAPAAPSAPRT